MTDITRESKETGRFEKNLTAHSNCGSLLIVIASGEIQNVRYDSMDAMISWIGQHQLQISDIVCSESQFLVLPELLSYLFQALITFRCLE